MHIAMVDCTKLTSLSLQLADEHRQKWSAYADENENDGKLEFQDGIGTRLKKRAEQINTALKAGGIATRSAIGQTFLREINTSEDKNKYHTMGDTEKHQFRIDWAKGQVAAVTVKKDTMQE